MDERVIDEIRARDGGPKAPCIEAADRVPSELTRILALGCRLARLVKNSPLEPHIKALASEFIHRADKATGNV